MAEVAFVVGLVASVIGIIDGVKTVWDAVKDPKGQPKAFRQVAARLPLVLSILEKAKSEANKLDDAAQEDLEKVLESCKEKAEKLNKIFKKVLPGDEDGRLDRYRKAVSAPFKGGRVEELMEGILRDAQLIATDKLMGVATEEQVKELADAITEMKEIPSSLNDEIGSVSQTHSGSGHNIANTGPGNTNNIQSGGSGSQYNIAGSAHFGGFSIRETNYNTGQTYIGVNYGSVNHNYSDKSQREWSPTSGNIYWVNLRPVNSFFTGQKRLLEEMHATLCNFVTGQGPLQNCFAITGIGGVGKSEVCLRFATTHRHFWGVFWIDASASSTIQRGYLDAANACQADRGSEIRNFATAKAFFDNVKHPYLFVLDNADNLELNLNPYIPTGVGATILITSRNNEMHYYGTSGAKTLTELEIDDAISLVFKVSNTPKSDRTKKQADAAAVVKLLAQHALAVIQAGAYISQRYCTLKEYIERFQRQRDSLLRFGQIQAPSRSGNVYAIFEISAQFVEESKSTNQAYANALELLGVLGHLYFTGVPQGMFTCASKYAQNIPEEPLNADDITGLSRWHVSRLPKFLHGLSLNDELDDLPTSLHDALGVLRSFAIITIQLETKEISMHPLAHAWARDRLIEADRQDAWVCTMSLIALSTCSCVSFVGTCHHDHEEFWRPLQPHIETCIDESPQKAFDIYPSIEIGRMFAQFAWFFYRADNFIRCKAQTTILRKKFDSEDPLLTNSSWIEYIHALCLIPLHDHHTAQGILERIVCSNEGSTAVTNRVLFATKMALAAIYLLEGKNQLAVDILREVVRTIGTSSQYSTLDVLWAQHEFARVLSMDGKPKDAISLLQDIVKMQKATTEPENPSRLSSLQRLAIELSKDGSHEEAISILRDVVQIQISTKKAGHVSLLASQHELAVALSRAGEHKEAILLFQDIVQIHKTNMNHINVNWLTSQHELAMALSRAGKHKQAVSLLQEVVQIQNTIFTPTHPVLISSQQALAWVLLWGGDYNEVLKIIHPVMISAEREWEPLDWRRRNCEFLIQECVAKKGKDANGTAVKIRGLQVKENGGEVREGGGERMKRWGEKMWEKKRWGKKS